jgi:hypothetical protein
VIESAWRQLRIDRGCLARVANSHVAPLGRRTDSAAALAPVAPAHLSADLVIAARDGRYDVVVDLVENQQYSLEATDAVSCVAWRCDGRACRLPGVEAEERAA